MADDVVAEPVHFHQLVGGQRLGAIAAHHALLIHDPAQERIHGALVQAAADDLRQIADALGELVGQGHVDDPGFQSPPVIHRLVGLIVEGAGADGLEDMLIELAPAPDRAAQGDGLAFLVVKIGAVVGVDPVLVGGVPVGDDPDAAVEEFPGGVALQAGPFQLDLRPGVGELGAQGEGVDGGGLAVDGIGAHIADAVVSGHGAGDGTGDELRLIDPGIIGAHRGIGHVQGAVEDAHLGEFHGDLQAGGDHQGAGGEDDLRALGNGGAQDKFAVLGGICTEIAAAGDALAELLLHIPPSGLVTPGPGVKQYLDLLRHIRTNGTMKSDRTGTGTQSVFGYQMRYDLSEGFPLLTTKKVHLKSIIYELLWFIAGDTNVKYLQDHGVTIWDEWADENGDLGPVYGHQWRSWPTPDGRTIDQLSNVINQIKNSPDSRRMIVSAWNVAEVEKMALPPCHSLFQFYVADGKLSCQLYQRSADVFLGVPFNIASYALLTMMIAQVCGLQPGEFVHTTGDTHIYTNHFEQVATQLSREPRALPKMKINPEVKSIFDFKYEDFELVDYDPYPRIPAPVAV